MSKYQNIKKHNGLYKDYKEGRFYNLNKYDELILSTLIAKEDKEVDGLLQYVKRLKEDTGHMNGLKECKEFCDILKDIGFVQFDFSTRYFLITDFVNDIRSIDDLIFIIDNDLTIHQFTRGGKLKKIINKINDGRSI